MVVSFAAETQFFIVAIFFTVVTKFFVIVAKPFLLLRLIFAAYFFNFSLVFVSNTELVEKLPIATTIIIHNVTFFVNSLLHLHQVTLFKVAF